jgi:hypothetical protein
MVLMWFWVGIKESSHILLSLLVGLSLSWNRKLKNIRSFLKKKILSPVFLHVNRFM